MTRGVKRQELLAASKQPFTGAKASIQISPTAQSVLVRQVRFGSREQRVVTKEAGSVGVPQDVPAGGGVDAGWPKAVLSAAVQSAVTEHVGRPPTKTSVIRKPSFVGPK
jgi:hypothetical protein